MVSCIILIFWLYPFFSCCQDDDLEETVKDNIKKNQYNFLTLSAWYKEQLRSKSPKKSKNKPALEMDKDAPLVIIIPNVEGFSSHILQNFILIAR